MRILSAVLVAMLVGCSTPAPVDLKGHPPPQDPIDKRPSGLLINKYTAITANGPQQRCVYTITGEDHFTLDADICYAYAIAPQSAIDHLAKINADTLTLQMSTTLSTNAARPLVHPSRPYIYDSLPSEDYSRQTRIAPAIER